LEKGGWEGFMKVISKSKIDTETKNLRRKNWDLPRQALSGKVAFEDCTYC
jgi:hypothetical protein